MNDRELLQLAQRNASDATRLADRLHTALRAIADRLDVLDGYPTTASGADSGPRGTRGTSSTERAVIARFGTLKRPGVVAIRDELQDWMLAESKATRAALAIIDTTAPPTAEHQPLCDGRGLEGFAEWGEACNHTADKAGLCHKHYMRCYRWRSFNGLRPLSAVA